MSPDISQISLDSQEFIHVGVVFFGHLEKDAGKLSNDVRSRLCEEAILS